MKRKQLIRLGLLAIGLLAPLAAPALDPITNRLTLSARFGLNISAKFSGASTIAIPATTRTTPDGDTYNYDNGYLFNDVSGSGDGLTWYAGYDDSSSQVNAANNTILLSRATGPATPGSSEMDDDPAPGAELAYTHELGAGEHLRYGFEAAANVFGLGMSANNPYSLNAQRVTDAFPYTPGTTPPGATPGSPYQGSFGGPGFVIGTTPMNSTTAIGTVGTVSGNRSLDITVWGTRLGPYLEIPLDDDIRLTLSGGLAIGWLNADVSWNETITFNGGGSLPDAGGGDDQAFLWGGYLAANLYWRLSERWTAAAGLQYQNLGTYEHTFGTRTVELDLSNSFFATLGLSYSF